MSKTITKVIPTMFLAISFSLASVFAFLPDDSISVPNIKQSKSNWCWAASGASCATALGRYTTEYQFASTVGKIDNVTARIGEVINGFNSLGISTNQFYATMPFSTLQVEVGERRRPVFIQGGNHATVASGYRTWTGIKEVILMDPWYGYTVYADYSKMTDSTYTYYCLGGLQF